MRGSSSAKTRGALSSGAHSRDSLALLPAHDEFLLLQMLGKETHAARPGDIGAGLVVARPFVAVKAMLRARIDMDLDLRPLGLDGLDIGQRNAGILLAEMELGRHLRLVIGEADDGAAVITDRRRQPRQLCRSRIGDAAAEAEADNADRADVLDGIDRGVAY